MHHPEQNSKGSINLSSAKDNAMVFRVILGWVVFCLQALYVLLKIKRLRVNYFPLEVPAAINPSFLPFL